MTEDKPFSVASLAERCDDHLFFISTDLDLATIRRRNLLTVISGLSSEGCQVKNPEAAIRIQGRSKQVECHAGKIRRRLLLGATVQKTPLSVFHRKPERGARVPAGIDMAHRIQASGGRMTDRRADDKEGEG